MEVAVNQTLLASCVCRSERNEIESSYRGGVQAESQEEIDYGRNADSIGSDHRSTGVDRGVDR